MIIEKNLAAYVVLADDILLNALQKISKNKMRAALVVSESGFLEGVLTDGDFRRWIVQGADVNLNTPVGEVANKQFISASISDDPENIECLFSDAITFVPLLSQQGRLDGIALRRMDGFSIGNHFISDQSPTFIIAEIGNNHNGSIELAKRLVDLAVESGADCAKFQLRDMATLYKNKGDANDASEDLGSQYVLDLLNKFQLKNEEYSEIFDYCSERGILPLCTPWDISSVEFLDSYGIQGFKVASADLTNHELMQAIAKTGKPLLCSTGMATEAEIVAAARLLDKMGAKYAFLHCNSTYPAPFKDINLRYLARLRQISRSVIGYSGHERGINVAIAAVTMGCRIIEKHFTVDKAMEGNDHKVSLLPHEFRAMVDGIREVEASLGEGGSRKITQGELMNREMLAKSLIINCDLRQGQIITEQMIDLRSPGKGIQPNRKGDLIGRPARRDMKAGDFFYPPDLGEESTSARNYHFKRPFGIAVRYHDFARMVEKSNLQLVEFHLSYKDLDINISDFLSGTYEQQLVVHAPELFAGDHILDLCTNDDAYRARSIQEMQRVIDVTRTLKSYFPNTKRPLIITNVGGFGSNGFVTAELRKHGYSTLKKSLEKLDMDGIEIIPQTMPPFPWHFGGQSYHNLFVRPEEIVEFCRENSYRVCFDISHSKLSCNYHKLSFDHFVRAVGPFTAHLHIVDAYGTDGEGLQIGEGDIDFRNLASTLQTVAPDASFIPEIWQGHKDEGAGFWLALERLEKSGF
jgi:sialic acid synthase SpsE/sugar phosphate isomerase/epimerase